jgi:uncharacterized repeat protein (TIGR03803 family)
VLHSFIKGEGANPLDGLLLDKNGDLYGTNSRQGYFQSGTVFELRPGGKFAPLHRFNQGVNGDGWFPYAPIIRDEAGNLYGTTSNGGAFGGGGGTVFKVDGQTGQETVLYSFGLQPDGAIPYGWVVRDALGNLYGTTVSGGAFCNPGCGTVFKLDPGGVETVLYSFTGGSDGNQPGAGLTLDSEGNLYGTTIVGGAFNNGTVFKLDPSGTFTVLHSFGAPGDGGQPIGSGVIRDAAGNLYGTTQYGGTYGNGTVYKLAPDGAVTILHSFSGGADGGAPWAGVSQDRAGNLYGTTRGGGDPLCICGVVYKITP